MYHNGSKNPIVMNSMQRKFIIFTCFREVIFELRSTKQVSYLEMMCPVEAMHEQNYGNMTICDMLEQLSMSEA